AAPAAPGPTNHDPIIIGSVGTYSGPAGGTLVKLPEGLQVWVKWINDRGGVNGHPVKLSVVDDGADSARYRSAVQDLVENKKAVALLAGGAPFTGKSMVEYLTQKRVPMIGEEGGSDWFYDSPVYFPIGATGKTFLGPAIATGLAKLMLPQGKKKWGSIACAEAEACAAADQVWHDGGEMEKAGLEPVYRARASLAQPDYTAECLAARNAGAEIVTTVMDDTAVSRIAASCGRQNYRPVFNPVGPAAHAKYKDDPNLLGGVMTIATFPWLKNDTPATAEFNAAMKKYFTAQAQPGHAYGWASGKVLEKAVAATTQPTTSAGILQGLWTFRNETLGGLTMPLTWVQDQLSPRQPCWSAVIVGKGTFEMVEGGRVQCKD
ncbi:MAG: ABC transporter substrate-binding protein, partial [Acidimicrobiia bacterium]